MVEIVAACVTTTFTKTVIVWPPGKVAMLHVIVPPAEPCAGPVQLPRVLLTEENCRFDGRTLVKATFGALIAP